MPKIVTNTIKTKRSKGLVAFSAVMLLTSLGFFITFIIVDENVIVKAVILIMTGLFTFVSAAVLFDQLFDYVMIKDNSTSQGAHFNFYSRNNISVPGNTTNVTEYLQDDNYLPNLLLTYNKKDTILEFTGNAAQYNYSKYASHSLIDYLYVLKNDLSLKYSTTADIHDTPPANPVDYDIYYHYGGTQWADEGTWTYVLMYHANGGWHKFSITDGTFFNEIGSLWDNISYSTIENNFTKLNPQPTVIDITSTPTSADMKHYLEINGNEVF